MKCYYCDFQYETNDEFKKHLNEKHYCCPWCEEVMSVDEFEEHDANCSFNPIKPKGIKE